MRLTHACILTRDMDGMKDFYEKVLGVRPTGDGPSYSEFVGSAGAILSLFDIEEHERFAPGSMVAASNESVMLEFEVDDVDKEYERLGKMDIEWVLPPTDFPWGLRAMYFRDPDGNVVSFYVKK